LRSRWRAARPARPGEHPLQRPQRPTSGPDTPESAGLATSRSLPTLDRAVTVSSAGIASSAPPTRRTLAPIRAAWVAALLGVLVVVPLGLLARVAGYVLALDLAVSDVLVVPGRGIGAESSGL
jgi:hypothetical protein